MKSLAILYFAHVPCLWCVGKISHVYGAYVQVCYMYCMWRLEAGILSFLPLIRTTFLEAVPPSEPRASYLEHLAWPKDLLPLLHSSRDYRWAGMSTRLLRATGYLNDALHVWTASTLNPAHSSILKLAPKNTAHYKGYNAIRYLR